ncbi:exopolysaccharide biosynthesis protein [Haloferula sp. BvORR071]|uniref:exopolysaccharide biosynthesis protein n=1 Tax=Haloferula sp. BvORR071 TaxID=1396141 RepID=UPI0006986A7F|nr:exopolysaccharide biosynthesis protein [Haloferula sp. BvORR071]
MPEEPKTKTQPPKSMGELLDRFKEAAEQGEEVSVDDLMNAIGRRSFGPLILLAGTVMSAPGISDIPSVGTLSGLFVGLVSVQILCGRDQFWLPGWFLRRKVSSKRILKMAGSKWTRKPAKWIDKFVTQRLEAFAGPKTNRVVAALCLLLAICGPLTEFIPLSGIGVGAALLAYGISLVARDGLMTLIGFAITAATVSIALVALT